MTNHKISNEKYVVCKLCNKKLQKIDNRHLKKAHNITLEEYRTKFPDEPTKTILQHEKDLETKRKREETRKNQPQNVSKQCWNYENCGHEVLVNINVGKTRVTCEKCKNKGLYHPDVIKEKEKKAKRFSKMNQDRDIINKRTEKLRNRNPKEIEKFKRKRSETLEKKLGPNWRFILASHTRESLLKIYGEDIYNIINKKREQTYYERTGFKNAMHNPEAKTACIVSRKENNDQNEITQRTIETNKKRYGGPAPTCDQRVLDKAKETRLLNQKERVTKYLEEIDITLLSNGYTHAHDKLRWKHNECDYEWESSWNQLWNNVQAGRKCPNCSPKITNKKLTQNKIQRFLESFGIKVLTDNRIFLENRQELDFLIPSKKIAIEYCGLYYHSNEVISTTRNLDDPKLYHLNKLEICESKGYQLITIFEDEWVEKQDIVKGRLKQLLGISTAQRIHARECKIYEITPDIKSLFLKNFHIQGSNDSAILSLGAYKNDMLVAIMSFGPPRGVREPNKTDWEIKRFCTDYNIHSPGIASKLLTYFKRNYLWNTIISFADRRWSNGNLYYKLGFNLDSKTKPAPWFIDCNKVKRYHRTIMWKTKEEKKSGLTQLELATIKGYRVIYDCGNLKFITSK